MLVRPLLVIALLLCGAPARAADAPAGPYLFDLLKQKPYLAAWNAMLSGAGVPAWVKNYAKTFDGPSSPSKDVPIQGKVYTLGWVCKAHDCGDNQLHVLFAPGAARLRRPRVSRNGSAIPTRGSKRRSTATSNNRIHHAFCQPWTTRISSSRSASC